MKEKKTVSQLFMILSAVYVTCLLLSNLTAGKMWAVTGVSRCRRRSSCSL